MELKKQALFDSALTEFRRAVIIDPNFVAAQIEIGFLCKEKARHEPVFNTHVYNAFRIAARLDLANEVSHNQYILAAQKMGTLDALRSEYEAWGKQYPDNELVKKCYKNIVTISLAMMPQQVSVNDGKSGLRKLLLFGALGLLFLGISMIGASFMVQRKAQDQRAKPLVLIGVGVLALSCGVMVFRSRVR